ncbi:hypothetical protein NQK81_28380 [Amycolatopsis roodepoortensis]|uniref:hypothetical protein n=1 Tax=Amycolatopsis roodepoortensis TaxID=700274 RepID=UPI00214A9913|nr:hypothetical protein [Amycolatopsis roodepoortensis]UUV28687.1 hypothetical protein NQK81_28380 [Amycolatopsis roodepoortensis]
MALNDYFLLQWRTVSVFLATLRQPFVVLLLGALVVAGMQIETCGEDHFASHESHSESVPVLPGSHDEPCPDDGGHEHSRSLFAVAARGGDGAPAPQEHSPAGTLNSAFPYLGSSAAVHGNQRHVELDRRGQRILVELCVSRT